MSEHILAFYDRSPRTDEAIKKAIKLARNEQASLYLLAIPPEGNDTFDPDKVPITKDLGAIAHLGLRAGVAVDGKYLDEPTVPGIRKVIEAQNIDQVILIDDEHADDTDPNAQLLHDLARDCPVPVTMVN